MLLEVMAEVIQMMTNRKTYSECIMLKTFEDRFRYLMLGGQVGEITFGFHRYLNQRFYHSAEWLSFKRDIIIRDEGRDLAFLGYDIRNSIIVHHINPITIDDVIKMNDCVFDPENVICTCHKTHNALHYGDDTILMYNKIVERKANDTKLW